MKFHRTSQGKFGDKIQTFSNCVDESACLAGVRKGVWGGGEVGYDIVPFRRERKCPCNEIGI